MYLDGKGQEDTNKIDFSVLVKFSYINCSSLTVLKLTL